MPNWITTLLNLLKGFTIPVDTQDYRDSLVASPPRSTKWPAVRSAHLVVQPRCQVCGNGDRKLLEVHHIQPYHLYPDLELTASNLITLCTNGPGKMNCHLAIGHGGNWKDYNLEVIETARYLNAVFISRIKKAQS